MEEKDQDFTVVEHGDVEVVGNPAALFAAMAEAQSKIEGATKDNRNDFFKSNYADLAGVWAACHKHLTSAGLCVIQNPSVHFEVVADKPFAIVTLTTILGHKSGAYICASNRITCKDNSPQGIGSATTYIRRYALAAIAGVAQVDDDGNAASERKQPGDKQASEQSGGMTVEEVAAAVEKIKNCTTVEELGTVWNSLNDSEKLVCKQLKDGLKSRLSKAAKNGSESEVNT